MRTSDKILRQVRRALAVVFLLSGISTLLLTGLALHALPLLSRDPAPFDPEQLWLLLASAGAAALVLLCIEAARERILQRAGLWLDHTLSQHLLVNSARQGTPAQALKGDAAAVARLRDALLKRALMPVLEAPWALGIIAVIALLHPMLAGVAALFAALLLLTAILEAAPVARLDLQRLRALERVASWWRALPTAPLSPDAAPQWERLNRPQIAASYALDRRLLLLRDVARAMQCVALFAVMMLGIWLLAHGELTAGALAAALLLHARLLVMFAGLLTSLKTVRRAMLDYRRLAQASTERHLAYPNYAAADAQHMPMPTFTAAIPRLRIGGPVALGFGATLLLLMAGLGAATLVPPEQIAGLVGHPQLAANSVLVRHAKGGIAARLHVARGAEVKAGDLLVTLDTTALDRQIAALRDDAEAARRQLEPVAREAIALASLVPATMADRAKLRGFEEQIADLQQRAESLQTRIAAAELDLARSAIRAPVSGRVIQLNVRAPNDAIAPGATVAQIATGEPGNLFDRIAEPLLRKVHRVLRSLYQENAA